MDPTWIAVIGGILVQIGIGLFFAGKYSERFERITKWIDDDAIPTLNDHETRLSGMERHR